MLDHMTPLPGNDAALSGGKTEILTLFQLHEEIRAAADAHAIIAPGDDLEELFYCRADEVEAQMLALPATCAADLAAKMILAHCYGDLTCLDWQDPVWLEARSLAGART